MGHRRFLVFYVISGVSAGIAFIYFSPRSSMAVIGTSGAIAGVMGAYYVPFPRARILTLIPNCYIPLVCRTACRLFSRLVVLNSGLRWQCSQGASGRGAGDCLVGTRRRIHLGNTAHAIFQEKIKNLPIWEYRRSALWLKAFRQLSMMSSCCLACWLQQVFSQTHLGWAPQGHR